VPPSPIGPSTGPPLPASAPLIKAIGLEKEYRIHRNPVPVLKGIDLSIFPGEILAILGHSGVGKSTLLNLLGLLDAPTGGKIIYRGRDRQFEDRDLTALSLTEKALIRNRHFGFVFQFYHLLPDLTVLENVLLPAMIFLRAGEYRRRKAELEERAERLLSRVGILERRDFPPTRLSGGERQRAAIARALLNEPEIVYCDEPTGNLDSATGEKIHQLMLELNRETRVTFVLVTHDEELACHAHRRLRMKDGQFEDGSGLV
jgi:lipoprotein-releasing system ATP-binding protein